jgi:peptidoglycan hydrolase-like protein with peptidoglycan-binding domain
VDQRCETERVIADKFDMEVTMRKLFGKFVLGTASVLVLGIGGAALDYAADAGDAVTAASMPAVSQPSESRQDDNFIRKDDIRWAQLELRNRGLYKGSLDGVLGPETKQALRQFQRNNGLSQTAALDAQSWEVLTSDTGGGLGASMPPDAENAGSTTNSPASNLGR